MARKIKLRGTPEQHRNDVESLLEQAKTLSTGKSDCGALAAALSMSAGAIHISRSNESSEQYARAWKAHVDALKKLAKKSCQYAIQKTKLGTKTSDLIVLVPGKKLSLKTETRQPISKRPEVLTVAGHRRGRQ